MKRIKSHKFLIRLTFVTIIHLIIKAFDLSFNFISEFTIRGLVFSIFFISYWIIIWYIAEIINQKTLNKQKNSAKQTFILFIIHTFFGIIVSFFTHYIYRTGDLYFFGANSLWDDVHFFNPELTCTLLAIYLMVFSFDIYLNSILEKKENQLQLEKLKQENNLAKYLNLKSQIEPHFLFNSLSVLSSIIYSDVNLASNFILRLSKILRYVIEKNELLLVPLKEEISFITDYFFLIKTRFEDGIIFENTLDEKIIESLSIPPVSLQLLFENAIKHNKFTIDNPLHIKLYNNNDYLIIENNINIRTDQTGSTKQGLENLSKRFSFLTKKPFKIENSDKKFIVFLPILSNINNESFNI